MNGQEFLIGQTSRSRVKIMTSVRDLVTKNAFVKYEVLTIVVQKLWQTSNSEKLVKLQGH